MPDRSVSRGREFESTGRGGAGNVVRSTSTSQPRVARGASTERGRELLSASNVIYSAGRGGAGNLRSPSRDTDLDRAALKHDSEVLRKHELEAANATYYTGRGGSGNVHSPTRDGSSRSRSREPYVSTGRGGAGNIVDGSTPRMSHDLGRLEEEDRREHSLHVLGQETVHSHGRGGAGNVELHVPSAHDHSTHVAPPHNPIVSTGRGGAGNFGH